MTPLCPAMRSLTGRIIANLDCGQRTRGADHWRFCLAFQLAREVTGRTAVAYRAGDGTPAGLMLDPVFAAAFAPPLRAPSPAGSFFGGFRTPGTVHLASPASPASETLHRLGHRPDHSITSSARATSVAGTSMPSILAVCRLMTNSNLVGCRTGRSAGFPPLRMRST
jgi:hypothetical protein